MITKGKEAYHMAITSMDAEQAHLIRTAEAMAAAARTAPKTKGMDYIESLILTDGELEQLARVMEEMAAEGGPGILPRDAKCVRKSGAVLLLGIGYHRRGIDAWCNYCGLGGCAACAERNAACAFDSIDLGIALGSAVSVAADARVDTRIMMSVGIAAKRMKLLPEGTEIVYGIPISISGKSPFFDR